MSFIVTRFKYGVTFCIHRVEISLCEEGPFVDRTKSYKNIVNYVTNLGHDREVRDESFENIAIAFRKHKNVRS